MPSDRLQRFLIDVDQHLPGLACLVIECVPLLACVLDLVAEHAREALAISEPGQLTGEFVNTVIGELHGCVRAAFEAVGKLGGSHASEV
ncbi:MAG TPA: hypothetical protein VFL57_22330 [Bryobacteraceae bacterium]|nr:hypothetical protein [Bryobacteraceae bacterium]